MCARCSPGIAPAPLCPTAHGSGGQSQRLLWNDSSFDRQQGMGAATTAQTNGPAAATAGKEMRLSVLGHHRSQQGPHFRVRQGSLPTALLTQAWQNRQNRSSKTFLSSTVFHMASCAHVSGKASCQLGLHAPTPAQHTSEFASVASVCGQQLCRNALNTVHKSNTCAAADASCGTGMQQWKANNRPAMQHSMHATAGSRAAVCSQGSS